MPTKKIPTYRPTRPNGTKKFSLKKDFYHTETWTEFRIRFLRANPRCYCCGDVARIVDHCVAAKDKEDLFFNETNYLPMCKRDHDTITALFDRHNPPLTEDKMKWIANRRVETETYVRVKVVSLEKR